MSSVTLRMGATAILALGATLVAAGLAEVAVRATGLAPAVDRVTTDAAASPFRLSSDPVLGYELKPSFSHPDADGIETNNRGLRDPERVVPKPDGVRRIALLGDSVAMGLYLTSGAQTIAGQLEARLADDRVEVLNFGVKGYCTQAEVRYFETRGAGLGTDLALVLFLRNDHRNFNGDVAQGFAYPRPAWTQGLFLRSHLFRLAAFRLDLWGFRAQLDPDYAEARNLAAFEDDNVDAGLRRLAQLAREQGFRAAVLVWPHFAREGPVDPDGLFAAADPTRMKVETIAARHGLEVVRLSKHFGADHERRAAAGEPRDAQELYTFDGMHPNAVGAAATAERIHELLRERPAWLGPPALQ
ncbi:MAG: SGNH/GDSL hydrolase family protein [Vicinamibacteria bacterium]|nr:SGNH/GDSL hydrolase family protein [Vicinamibacteria bacterium]